MLVASRKVSRLAPVFVLLLMVVLQFAGTAPAQAAGAGPSPIKVIRTSHGTEQLYDLQQLLGLSGVTTRVVSNTLYVGHGKVSGNLPDITLHGHQGSDLMTLTISLTFLYYNDHFTCAYGAASAQPTPNAQMILVGGLYYGGAYIDGFNLDSNQWLSYLGDETGCWNDGDAAVYEMTSAVIADYPNGGTIDLSGSVSGYAL
jgi:hypothetical protein